MKTIHVNKFATMTNDIYSGRSGDFASTRNFDVIAYPTRLFPLPSMQNATASTLIGNMIVDHLGTLVGVGDSGAPAGALYKKSGGVWSILSASAGFGSVLYNFLVNFPRNGAKSTLFAVTSGSDIKIVPTDPAGNAVDSRHTITGASSIYQGFVHPDYNILYFPYKTSSGTFIGSYDGSTWADSSTSPDLTLPSQYTPTSLTNYGKYLAIACTTTTSSGVASASVNSSVVFLWDTTSSTWNEMITWGDNSLQVMNNLNGVLVGVSSFLSNDSSSILVKGYAGAQVETLKEIGAIKQTTTSPTIVFNPRVNFIHRNRFHFSVDIAGGSTSPVQKGLWSFGKNKDGNWSLTVERFASVDGTDVSVIAAAYQFDYLQACHTAEGTLTEQLSTNVLATDFASASIYESVVNPEMPDADRGLKKKLHAVAVHCLPLVTGQQIVMKYRVDATTAWASAATIFTKTPTSPNTELTAYETSKPVSGQFRDGRNYEFRIESIGGAQVTGYSYKYEILHTNI